MKTNSLSELGRITNYQFYDVRNLIVSGYDDMLKKGYTNMIAQVIVKNPSVKIYTLSITFWVIDCDGNPKPYCAEQQLFGMINIPSFVADELFLHSKYEVRLTSGDILTLKEEMMFDVNTSHKAITSIIRDKAASLGMRHTDMSVDILEEAFCYKVDVFSANGLKLFTMLTATVEDLPTEIGKALVVERRVTFNISI